MGATTPNIGLYKPGGGSSGLIVPDEVADVDRLNGNFDLIDAFAGSVQTWQTARNKTVKAYYGLASERATLPGPLGTGDTYQETDGQKLFWWYDGAAWVHRDTALYKVYPQGVVGTGATVADSGEVMLANSKGDVNINGIVPPGAKEVLIEIHIENAAAADFILTGKARVGGADVTGSAHNSISVASSIGSGPTRGERIGDNSWFLGRVAVSGAMVRVRITNPLSSAPRKFMDGNATDATMFTSFVQGTVQTTSALDGITLNFPTAGTTLISGHISIYALV